MPAMSQARKKLLKQALEQGYSEAEWAKIEAANDLKIDQDLLEEAKDIVRRDPAALDSRKVRSAIYHYNRSMLRSDPDTQAAFKRVRRADARRGKLRMDKFSARTVLDTALTCCMREIAKGEPDRWSQVLELLREGHAVAEIFPRTISGSTYTAILSPRKRPRSGRGRPTSRMGTAMGTLQIS